MNTLSALEEKNDVSDDEDKAIFEVINTMREKEGKVNVAEGILLGVHLNARRGGTTLPTRPMLAKELDVRLMELGIGVSR